MISAREIKCKSMYEVPLTFSRPTWLFCLWNLPWYSCNMMLAICISMWYVIPLMTKQGLYSELEGHFRKAHSSTDVQVLLLLSKMGWLCSGNVEKLKCSNSETSYSNFSTVPPNPIGSLILRANSYRHVHCLSLVTQFSVWRCTKNVNSFGSFTHTFPQLILQSLSEGHAHVTRFK